MCLLTFKLSLVLISPTTVGWPGWVDLARLLLYDNVVTVSCYGYTVWYSKLGYVCGYRQAWFELRSRVVGSTWSDRLRDPLHRTYEPGTTAGHLEVELGDRRRDGNLQRSHQQCWPDRGSVNIPWFWSWTLPVKYFSSAARTVTSVVWNVAWNTNTVITVASCHSNFVQILNTWQPKCRKSSRSRGQRSRSQRDSIEKRYNSGTGK